MAGRALQDLVAGRASNWREAVFVQISEDHIGRAVRTKKWKYSVWVPRDKPRSGVAAPGSDVYTEQCLYDLEKDPFERHNLIADPALAPVREELAAILKRMMAEAGERVPEILPVSRRAPRGSA
jgi:arylsulfatase A-like enzyme